VQGAPVSRDIKRRRLVMSRVRDIHAASPRKARNVGLVDFYPWAGLVGIATYLFVECFLE
jgi:hypothetical protein